MKTHEEVNRVWKRWKWVVYFSFSLPYLIVYFHRVSLNVVANELMKEFQLNGALLGTLAGIYFYVYTFLQIPSGIFADVWGPRKTTAAGMITAGMGAALFGLAPNVLLLFAGRILVSIGVSFIFISILKIQSSWFQSGDFARVSGITVFIGNAGALLAATPLVMLDRWANWHVSFLLMGVLSFFAAWITWCWGKDHPSQMGLPQPDHIGEGSGTVPPQESSISWKSIRFALKSILTNYWSWLLFIAFFGIFGSFLTFQGVWGVPYFMQVFGMGQEEAANLLGTMTIGHMIGCLLVGWISDSTQKRKPVYLSFLTLYIFSWTLMIFSPQLSLSIFQLYPIAFMIGLSASCFILTWGWAKEVNDPKNAGMAMGTVNMSGFLGAALMQPFFGMLLDLGWDGTWINGAPHYSDESFMIGFLVNLAFVLISFFCIFLMKETHNTNQYSSIVRENLTRGSAPERTLIFILHHGKMLKK